MASGMGSDKVINLQPRLANPSSGLDQAGALIKHCRGMAQARLSLLLGSVFDGADDSLFELAKKAENGHDQQAHFDAMRELRKKRQLSEKLFSDQLMRGFLHMGTRAPQNQNAEKLTLALLDDRDMEEALALSAMIEKGRQQLAHHLYVLEQRLSVLVGGHLLEPGDNPIGPKAISEAFHATLAEQELSISAKLLILKLFDKHVIGGVDLLYQEVNEYLLQAGVLPHLKFPRAMQSGSSDTSRSGHADTSTAEQPAGDVYYRAAAAAVELRIEVYNTLRSLLQSRRLMSESYVQPSGPAFATDDLVNALSLLQHQSTAPNNRPGSEPAAPWVPIGHIKQELVGQLQVLAPQADQQHVADVDEDTIDLVGMLFEFVFQDRNLPTRLQALLARLQIPYLKCAILNKQLFAQKDHPARLLLDELAHAGMSWTAEGDKDGRFLDKVKTVVESLLQNFREDVQIFEKQLESFREFNRAASKRAEVVELRVAQVAQGAERLHVARQTATAEMVKRVDGRPMPEVIRYLLTRPWANVLVLALLRHGEESAAWKTLLRVADALVWSAQPKASDADRARLRAMAPELERALRQGLAMVAFHEKDLQQLMSDLKAFHEQQCSAAAAPSAPAVVGSAALLTDYSPSSDSGSSAAAGECFVAELARTVPTPLAEASVVEEIDDEFHRVAQDLKVGTWVEFRGADSTPERAKLSWVSPISHKFVFVNRKGLKVADKSVLALAAELRRGTAVVLEAVPLFDRALDAIVEKLKSVAAKPAT